MTIVNDCEMIIIIGAGAAGLAAARHLAQAGIKPLLIEARDRIGGRVHTIFENNVPVELGAEFIHGAPPEIFDIVREAGLETLPTSWSRWHFTPENGLGPADASDRAGDEKIWQKLDQYVDRGGPDISLAEFLDNEGIAGEARQKIEGYVNGFHAAPADKIGVRSLVKTERAADKINSDHAFRLPNGYHQVIEHLWREAKENGAQIRLNLPVSTVKWGKNGIEIVAGTEAEVFRTRAAIITLPISILKAGSVTFEPPLKAKQAALDKIEMGPALRVIFHFKSKWWNGILEKLKPLAQPLGFLYAPQETIQVWWTNEPAKPALLTGWAGGPRARELGNLDRESLVANEIKTLARIFSVRPEFIREQILSASYHDWLHDPLSLGAYTYMAVDGADAPAKLAEPLENTLFFAGEATNFEGHWGTVHGAIASGLRAAREVIAAND
ncbi:MAG TPA: NAD(P)/FAD-dependent oxidoreductase [Pyrinomonadaceae bacterium]|jgi:monoamine oxidase|nr:NAD(P)/FAD-dependent oxidoreductase [Pyrinomonadaceae bacterium]